MTRKKILLAVCGSISFYKAFEILSELKKENFDVYVALSEGVLKFVDYHAFDALCEHPVLCSKTEDWQEGLNHIEYAKMDLILVAPASVNTINKLAWGVCDNIFLQTLIASDAKMLIAPAANEKMLTNPITKNCIHILKEKRKVEFIEPVVKKLACGDVAKGGLADINTIIYAVKRAVTADNFYENKMVVITGGPTIEKIDDVRAITNLSSGKMGRALADAFYMLGADVTLISSVDFSVPYKLIKFDSSIGLKSALDSIRFKENSLLVMAAAVSDYTPRSRYKGKLKKEELGDLWTLRLGINNDILSSIESKKLKKIGFKMESDQETALMSAKKTLIIKHLDAVCLNILDSVVKFGSDDTKITFITKNSEIKLKQAPKSELAMQIAELAKSLF